MDTETRGLKQSGDNQASITQAALRRCLVFGSSGAGKSTALNNLTGQTFDVSDGALGCTFSAQKYDGITLPDGNVYKFIDTVGLNEGTFGKVPTHEAVKNLLRLMRSTKKGYNLLIMVMKKGRIDVAMEKNYELFVRQLLGNLPVPVILMVTNCEDQPSLDHWPAAQKHAFDAYKLHFDAMVGTSWATSVNPILEGEYAKMRSASKDELLQVIQSKALQDPVCIDSTNFWDSVRKVWNWLSNNVYPLPKFVGRLGEFLINMMGFTKEQAIAAEEALET